MEKHLYYYPNHTAFQAVTSNPNLHNVIYCDNETHVHYDYYDYSKDYLTFIAKENGTFTFTPQNSNVISYSTDGGETWTQGNSVSVNIDDKVMWKGTMTSELSQGVGNFSSTAEFDVQGNAMSLLYGDNYKEQLNLTKKIYAFDNLFRNNNKIISAKNLSLPATTLESGCYGYMFNGCTSLTVAPSLPAITLAEYCYDSMFQGCISLTVAPELPATTLANNCYDSMFYKCTSMATAPELPATTLAERCYDYMFKGCTSLNYIKAMFTTTPSTTYTTNWVNGVASNGTFVKNSAATWNVTGVNGIPTGWTVQNASN